MQLVLASQSPRRAELLTQLGIQFSVQPANIDESTIPGESACDYVQRLAISKARAGWQLSEQTVPVLGSDTVCVLNDEILTKPIDENDSIRILSGLSNTVHLVLTSVAIVYQDRQQSCVVTTEVEFTTLSEQQIKRYWQTGEPQDKAGSYAIQGVGGQFVRQIRGSYSAVVGLPLCETSEMLKQFGINTL